LPIVADAAVAVRGDLKPFLADMKQGERSADALGAKLTKALSPRALTSNVFGKGPAELARSFDRAADSAQDAFAAVQKLDRTNIDTAKARKYAQVLEDISIEAQQTRADLAALQKADPRFNTPQLQAAADQLDRVGREAADSARSLNQIKGVGASTEFERLANEAREAGTSLDTAGKRTDTLMGKLRGVKGILLGLGLAVGTQQILSFASDAAEVFIDLERAGKSVDQIFGNASATIDDWAERSADAAGLSQREVKSSAAVQGQALINMGYDAQSAADEVVKLQQRGSDLAATFGGTTADAILAVGSLLRGERDPIEKFGVTIRQVDVNARIAALGLDISTDAARRNAEAIASLDLFYEQTAGNAGRFADSQDDVGVQLDKNQAKIEDGMAVFGREVASIQLGAVKVGDAIGGYLDTSSRNIAAFAMNFGQQHQQIDALAQRTGISFEEMKQRILNAMDFSGLDAQTIIFQMEGGEEAVAYTKEQALAAVRAVSDAYVLGGPVVAREAGRISGMLPSEIRARDAEIRAAGMENIVQFAAGMIDKQNDPLLAMEALARANEEVLSRSAEISRLMGQLNSAELAAGLADGRPEVRLAAQAAAAEIEARLRHLGAWNWGYQTGVDFASGLQSAVPVVYKAAAAVASATAGQIGIRSEPDDHSSPLYGHLKWGGNLVRDYAKSILGELGTVRGASAAMAGALVPSLAMSPASAAIQGGAMAAGGPVTNNYLVVEGKPKQVSDAQEMWSGFEQMSDRSITR